MGEKKLEEFKTKEMKKEEMKKEETKEKELQIEESKDEKNDAGKMKEETKEEEAAVRRTEVKRTETVQAQTGDSLTEEKQSSKGKKNKTGKIVFAVFFVLIVLLAAVYLGVALYYRNHFLPNTDINGIECGNMDVMAVVPLIDAQISDYSLLVTGRDFVTGESGTLLGIIQVEDIELAYADTEGAVEDIMSQQNIFLWPRAYLGTRNEHSLVQGIVFDESMLRETVSSWDACQIKNMQSPENAYISDYNDAVKGYEVIPETAGTELDMEKVFECITAQLHIHESSLDLEEALCYTEAAVKSTDSRLVDAVETANSWLSTEVVYDWNGNEVVLDAETLKDWVTVENEQPALDEEAVEHFVKIQAGKFDTYGKRKNFVTSLGIELTLNSPNYGWKTDIETETEELLQLIYQGSVTEKEPVYSIKAQKKGMNDVGNSYVEADLTHQHLYVYQDGEIVFETNFVSGKMNSTPDCITPPGIFGLTYKTTNAVLRGADYETPVNYWMPFYGNYGMHDATWRVNFGGTIYQEYGSHGCINLPLDSAAVIYGYVSTGFPVVCYYYEVDPLAAPAEQEVLTEEELMSQQEPTISGNEEQIQNQEG